MSPQEKQQQILQLIKESRYNDKNYNLEAKMGTLRKLTEQDAEEINNKLRIKIKEKKKLIHNERELTLIDIERSKNNPAIPKKELDEMFNYGDEGIYKQKELIRELSCPRLAAIYNVSPNTIHTMEGRIKRAL